MSRHSDRSASGSERWMNCHGSVTLNRLLRAQGYEEPPESEHAREGIAVHDVAAQCLTKGIDAWEFLGETVADVEVTDKMVAGAQVYVDHVRPLMAAADHTYIEKHLSAPVHPAFHGTVDFAAVFLAINALIIRDYKNGAGVVVEVEGNPQFMYYAYLILALHPEIEHVSIGVVQPNAYHKDGPIRIWPVSAQYIREWVTDTLVPHMVAADTDKTLDPGEHCRFCPAKLICPMVRGLFSAAANYDTAALSLMTDEELSREAKLVVPVRMVAKAIDEELLRRLTAGKKMPDWKIVARRADRVWKEGAVEIFEGAYPNDCHLEPEFKSPAQMEKIANPLVKGLVKQWAYTPSSGPTVAPITDNRPEMKVQTTQEKFGHLIENV